MAYAFDRIMTAMGRQRKDDRPAIDSGGRQAPGQSAANPGGRTAPLQAASNPLAPSDGARAAPTNDRVMASSTQAALPASGGAGGAAEPAAAQGPQQTPASRGRLFAANAGRVGAPVDLSAMGQRIAGMRGKVQNEANTYVSAARKSYNADDVDSRLAPSIDTFSGIGPGSDTGPESQIALDHATDTPANNLGGEPFPFPQGMDPDVEAIYKANNNSVSDQSWTEAFQNGPGEVSNFVLPFSTNIADTDLIGTDAGIGELFRRGGGAEYTAGDAGFDTALLRRNAAFNALRDQTLQQDRDLQSYADTIDDTAKVEAQDALDASYGGWKDKVTGRLTGNLDVLKGRGGERETAFDDNLTSQAEKNLAKKFPKMSAEVLANLKKENPDWTWEEGAKSVDPSSYYDPGVLSTDKTNWNDFLGEQEAGGWNNVMNILGREGPAYSQGQYYDKNYGDYVNPEFDSSGYAEDLIGATEKLPKLVTESGVVDYSKIPPPHKAPSAGGPIPVAPPTGTIGIDTGDSVTPLDGTTTIDPNSVKPVGARPTGTVALDVESGGDATGGSQVNTGNDDDTINQTPWWVPQELPRPQTRLPKPVKFPKIRAQMGR